ncbi:hypothetical protein EYF80_038073 [Liparis tanakae]|uniref:Uncharacterized protein n=1 Tax=Liparis tanakae TaxID=230148 RepID=A0A4Z2GFQ2_9TELE|nr:hypothetical protein EYF80_038073 [Liparis tanakae]
MKREKEREGDNPHDSMTEKEEKEEILSSCIIHGKVREGLSMANASYRQKHYADCQPSHSCSIRDVSREDNNLEEKRKEPPFMGSSMNNLIPCVQRRFLLPEAELSLMSSVTTCGAILHICPAAGEVMEEDDPGEETLTLQPREGSGT